HFSYQDTAPVLADSNSSSMSFIVFLSVLGRTRGVSVQVKTATRIDAIASRDVGGNAYFHFSTSRRRCSWSPMSFSFSADRASADWTSERGPFTSSYTSRRVTRPPLPLVSPAVIRRACSLSRRSPWRRSPRPPRQRRRL